MGSRYYDTTAVIQVIGSILKDPSLLNDEGKYFFHEEDFINDFHKVIFGGIYNLYKMGAKNVNSKALEDYFKDRPQSKLIYQKGNGSTWVNEIQEVVDLSNFDYYYQRLKKMSLLRAYDDCGLDVKFIYDPDNIFDINKKQQQENYLDKLSLNEIANLIENKVNLIRQTCIDNATDDSYNIGDGLADLVEELKQEPEMGPPMYGPYINTVTRGMRYRKFYLRSAATGVGKSRSMIADACNAACSRIYNISEKRWQDNGLSLPAIFISTELELSECQTMALAFISGVNEEHILYGQYDFGEEERVREAVKILQSSPLYIEELPDFSLRDIENCIKRNIRVHGCQIVVLDYIHTSMKILEEISQRSGGVRLREDNILFLLSVKLKDLANEFGVFILSATQLNESWKDEKIPDQNMLRGAKSIADKVDVGMIMLDVTKEDEEAIKNIIEMTGFPTPNVKVSVYKNRRGSYNRCFLWQYANKGICRFETMFVTDYNYNLIPIKDVDIIVSAGDTYALR